MNFSATCDECGTNIQITNLHFDNEVIALNGYCHACQKGIHYTYKKALAPEPEKRNWETNPIGVQKT